MRFRVSLHRRIFAPSERNRNPFLAGIPHDRVTHEMSVRTWTFEARDEKHVRELLAEAQDARHINVAGYTIRSIERMPDCCRPPCPEHICRAMTANGMCFANDAATKESP